MSKLMRRPAILLATTALIKSFSVCAAAQQMSADAKQADKIRGAVLGSLLADSISLGRFDLLIYETSLNQD
jgi:hypothetical protein